MKMGIKYIIGLILALVVLGVFGGWFMNSSGTAAGRLFGLFSERLDVEYIEEFTIQKDTCNSGECTYDLSWTMKEFLGDPLTGKKVTYHKFVLEKQKIAQGEAFEKIDSYEGDIRDAKVSLEQGEFYTLRFVAYPRRAREQVKSIQIEVV